MILRKRCMITGRVQGVGFRPFVFREAVDCDLVGFVGNVAEGVCIEVQGHEENMHRFFQRLEHCLPPLAVVTSLSVKAIEPKNTENAFQILVSAQGGNGHTVLVSPDMALCESCKAELFDPTDRRYLYPFINCTDCGPRYTITHSIPYDRKTTSMACFPFCPECAREYADPLQRRFHAQPNACPVCGPKVWLVAGKTASACSVKHSENQSAADTLQTLAQALSDGHIAAIKGLGGFHLVCDARNTKAVATLRERKKRPHKALAIMVASLEEAKRFVSINAEEAKQLTSPEAPIVLLQRRDNTPSDMLATDTDTPTANTTEPTAPLPNTLAPDTNTLGVMLPYTPLHHCLLHLVTEQSGQPAVLVMTSGNHGGEPICLGNREALSALKDLADIFLLHDRDILIRADDTVLRVVLDKQPQLIRRARGFTPSPLPLPPSHKNIKSVLACGADLKNVLCLTRGHEAFVSQHIGDLAHPRTTDFFYETLEHLQKLLEVQPQAVLCDAHPDYVSTRFAEAIAKRHDLPLYRIQHHKAHLCAVLGEHMKQHEQQLSYPLVALTLDGTGYGEDGTIWGGEVFVITANDSRATTEKKTNEHNTTAIDIHRYGRLRPLPLFGGEKAIREPWRMARAVQRIYDLSLPACGSECFKDVDPRLDEALNEAVFVAHESGLLPMTSSCGRLFDAASAFLGLCPRISYEGQAAIRLEQHQETAETRPLPWAIHKEHSLWELDSVGLLRGLTEGLCEGVSTARLARRFHLGLAEGFVQLTLQAAQDCGTRTVLLSGGVFQNKTILENIYNKLTQHGLQVFFNNTLPPNDAAVAYGQAVWFSLFPGL